MKLPVVVTVFPDEIYAAPETWAEKAYSKMIYYKKIPERRTLRGVGAAGVLRHCDARGLQITALA